MYSLVGSTVCSNYFNSCLKFGLNPFIANFISKSKYNKLQLIFGHEFSLPLSCNNFCSSLLFPSGLQIFFFLLFIIFFFYGWGWSRVGEEGGGHVLSKS